MVYDLSNNIGIEYHKSLPLLARFRLPNDLIPETRLPEAVLEETYQPYERREPPCLLYLSPGHKEVFQKGHLSRTETQSRVISFMRGFGTVTLKEIMFLFLIYLLSFRFILKLLFFRFPVHGRTIF